MAQHVLGDDLFINITIQGVNANSNTDPSTLTGSGSNNMKGIARRVSTHGTTRKVNVKGMNNVAQANVYTDFESTLEIESFTTSAGAHALSVPAIGYWIVVGIGAATFKGVIDSWNITSQTSEAVTVTISVCLNVDFIAE